MRDPHPLAFAQRPSRLSAPSDPPRRRVDPRAKPRRAAHNPSTLTDAPSPTSYLNLVGTGKTLCLLCAALGWRETVAGRDRPVALEGSPPPRRGAGPAGGSAADAALDPSDRGPRGTAAMESTGEGEMSVATDRAESRGGGGPAGRGPVIIYASRTHSQLTQVIRELRATRYRPRMAVIGSRQQMCVHKDVSTLTGMAQNTACKSKTDARACAHHNEVDRFVQSNSDFGKTDPVDIEDLVHVGQRGKVGGGCGPCPYYLSRDMASRADIIFMPYNYLIDPKLREAANVPWKGAVLLFDEAHNIEGVCADAASFDLPAAHLAGAVREAQEAFELAAAEEQGLAGREEKEKLRFNARGRDEDDGFGGGGERLGVNGNTRAAGGDADAKPKRRAVEYKQLRGILLALENKIAETLAGGGGGGPNGKGADELVRPCEAFFDMLAELRVVEGEGSKNTVRMLVEVMTDAVVLLAGEAAAVGRKSRSRASSFRLSEVSDALEKAFRMRREGHLASFRLRIGPDESRGGDRSGGAEAVADGRAWSAGMSAGPTLSFWCFGPGVIMTALRGKGVRSVVLTSGTLSPMASFASELRLPFPVRLENPHVIGSNQVWGGIVPVGPSGKKLNSSYRFRDTEEYKAELGNVVVNFARVVPDGLLVFFPSYGVMRSCVATWQQHGNPTIWERICAAKFAVVEPRDKVEFARAFAEFNEALDAPRAAGRNGAAFFAVCRGKVSEGIDFADKAGRAVILTGIPYAPKADAKVRIKRSFLDNEASAARAEGGAGGGGLTGEQWYSQTAMRAVNQALGRVIRHRNDFGAVILADERFGYGNVRGQLSVWLRPAVQSFDSFGKAAAKLAQFFRHHAANAAPPLAKKPTGARFDALGREPNVDGSNPVPDAARANASGATRAGRVALPAQFRVEVDAAPPAYPRANGAGKLAAMLAAKRGTGTPGTGTGTEIPGTGTRTPGTGTGRISALGALARAPAPPAAAVARTPAAAVEPSDASEKIKLFMRRARSELSKKSYDDLTRALREFRAGETDVGGVLKAASRALRAQDDPYGLYALFGAFVPAEHRHVHEKHVAALRARAAALGGTKRAREDGDGEADGEALDRGEGSGGGGGLSRSVLARGASLGQGGAGAGLSNASVSPRPAMSVACPPPRCVVCGDAARKPFEAKCGHPGCYSCWLELLKSGEGGAGATCPSCHKPVLKRQLTKMFFT